MGTDGGRGPGYDPVPVKYLPWLAVAILAGLIARWLFPVTDTVTEYIRLPSQTIYDTVEVSRIDSVEVVRFRDRPVFQTDTMVLRDTVLITFSDTIQTLPPRWRLTALQAGQGLDSKTLVLGDLLTYDGALTHAQTFESYPVTLGPVTDIRTDSLGIHIRFGSWPEPPKTCGVGCVAQWTLGGLAAGFLLGKL